MKRSAHIALLALALLICSAHIGSPEVWYDGPAGPYSVRVLIRPPRVVPGLAGIAIRVRGGAERVAVAPSRFDTGTEGTPSPDIAQPVRGDPESYSAQLWLMARGAYRIVVTVEGAQGRGTAVIPVTATATERLGMPRFTGAVLLLAMAFLLTGLFTLVGAAVREGQLPAGEVPGPQRMRRARQATAGSVVIAALLLLGGWRWWSAVDAYHRARLDRPLAAQAQAFTTADGSRVLGLAITDSLWLLRRSRAWLQNNPRSSRAALIPDHGKLMHMFLVRDDQAAFAHVHPVSLDSTQFEVLLPSLPGGRYAVYGEIVEESGAAYTIVAGVQLSESGRGQGEGRGKGNDPGQSEERRRLAAMRAPADPDDASWSGPGIGSLRAASHPTEGLVLRLRRDTVLVAGRETELRVEAMTADGLSAVLEPYMGMAAHMVIRREDGSVFVHLHPQGTISMAAQSALSAGTRTSGTSTGRAATSTGTSTMVMPHMQQRGSVGFPYAFPQPGRYRIWGQVKHEGRVLTGAFDVDVEGEQR